MNIDASFFKSAKYFLKEYVKQPETLKLIGVIALGVLATSSLIFYYYINEKSASDKPVPQAKKRKINLKVILPELEKSFKNFELVESRRRFEKRILNDPDFRERNIGCSLESEEHFYTSLIQDGIFKETLIFKEYFGQNFYLPQVKKVFHNNILVSCKRG